MKEWIKPKLTFVFLMREDIITASVGYDENEDIGIEFDDSNWW